MSARHEKGLVLPGRFSWIFRTVCAVCAGFIASVALVEGGLQLIRHSPLWRALPIVEPILGRPDRDLGYDFVPGAWGIWPKENRAPVRINQLGLRDSPMELEKPEGTTRVAITGNSIVEALQVEQALTFDSLAEGLLLEQHLKVEIANLAMAGSTPLQQLIRFEKLGTSLDIDLLIMFVDVNEFSSGNLVGDLTRPGYIVSPEHTVRRGYAFRNRRAVRYAEKPIGKAFVALYQNIELFRLLYLWSRTPWVARLGLELTKKISATATRTASDDSCFAVDNDTLRSFWIDHVPDSRWIAAHNFFQEIRGSVIDRGIPAIVAIRGIPATNSTCPEGDERRQEIVSVVRQAVEKSGATFVDWEDALARALPDNNSGVAKQLRRLHGFGSSVGAGHLNYAGHRVYADVLARVILDQAARKRSHRKPSTE
jgi:hypothetical protein